MGTKHRSGFSKKSNDKAKLLITTIMGMVCGYFIGVSFPSVSLLKIHLPSNIQESLDGALTVDHRMPVRDPKPESRVSTDVLPPKVPLHLF